MNHPANTSTLRPVVIATLCLVVIAASALWIHRSEFAAPKFNVALHQAVGRVMAEETARAVNQTGRVVIVAIELAGVPELKVQLEEFERALRRFPHVTIKEKYLLEADDKPKYSFGAGLSSRRFVRLVNKNQSADAIVSFVGAPSLSTNEMAELKKTPKFIAEARAADKLKPVFAQKILHTAIVSRFQFPTPVKGRPANSQEWFDQRWQVVTAANAAELPDGRGE
jgi:hypothetical protein